MLEALAAILLAKLYRRNLPRAARAVYREYSNSPEMRRKAQVSRRKRGRKLLAGPAGSRYHLTALFDDLNRQYFKGRLPLVRLGWSLRKSRRILGHFDPSHRTITLSRWLDRPRVPEVVVRFVLFHEMLHAKLLARSVSMSGTRTPAGFGRRSRPLAGMTRPETGFGPVPEHGGL